MMNDILEQSPETFSLEEQLLNLCKNKNKIVSLSAPPQIDFLILDEKIKELQHIQEKTCEQIVQFVDQNCGEYINISDKLQQIQGKINKVGQIVKTVSTKVKDYASVYYQTQSKIQSAMNLYETSIIQKQLLKKCKQQATFITKFIVHFEKIISKSIQNLNFREKQVFSRFCFKYHYLTSLLSHNLLHQSVPQYIRIHELVLNLADQVEFYISEQLVKVVKSKQSSVQGSTKFEALNFIKMCYTYLRKQEEYYKNIQEGLIGRQLSSYQRTLSSNKMNLIAGKNVEIIQDFFKSLFGSIKLFPKTYPEHRILKLIFQFLKKNELKFLYTYTLPIFPVSYVSYLESIQTLPEKLKHQLKLNHNWDIKRWIDVRQKNILDRSWKDQQGTLQKWIDIVFKQNCMLEGAKTDMVKLALKIVNRYALKITEMDYNHSNVNKCVFTLNNIHQHIQAKICKNYQNQNNQVKIQDLSEKISLTCKKMIEKAVRNYIIKNTKMLSTSCIGCLQTVKSFVMKILKKQREVNSVLNQINTIDTILKPLNSYLTNTPQLSIQSSQFIQKIVLQQLVRHYDEIYVKQIYSYAKNNVSAQQFSCVMQVVGKQRTQKFLNQNFQQQKNQQQKSKKIINKNQIQMQSLVNIQNKQSKKHSKDMKQ